MLAALPGGMANEQREDLAHAIVYPTKTKPTGAFKKQPSTCGKAVALDGNSNSHQSVGAIAAHERAKERRLYRGSSAPQRYK